MTRLGAPGVVVSIERVGNQLKTSLGDFSVGKRITLAFQTLGVVFGDVGTSPLYTFSVMFSKSPINGNEDVIGALSLVLYTLILIPLVKYVLVVLWANDDGEGGTFALYSLICRHAKVSLLPNQLPSDARISSFRLKVPSAELERSLKIKERLETSQALKKLLLMLVLAGTCMVIADGVVTPAMSVTSAVGGLKVGVDAIEQGRLIDKAIGASLLSGFSVGEVANVPLEISHLLFADDTLIFCEANPESLVPFEIYPYLVRSFFRLAVGAGSLIRFWDDVWCIEQPSEACIPRVVSYCLDWELESVSSFLEVLYSAKINRYEQDKMCWQPSPSTGFQVKSYKHLSSTGAGSFLWKNIWKAKVPQGWPFSPGQRLSEKF
uniref:K+ potassium transporter integral membrane domain-containing protein n=1 Tax=Fagus sylvatica TaxID=28930 RepID=A0A2N9ITN7_FAGSY